MTQQPYKKKLIEVALPLEAINKESIREGFIYRGNPSAVHKWWAQRPLAACRAVLFASLVDDPSSLPEQFPTEEAQERERQRLFRIIEELVKWENSNNEEVLEAARAEIMCSTGGNAPPVYDPFCGGGSIPLEAQRLGLEAHASDLNPVAVLITKALIEIPPKFAGRPPVNPEARAKIGHGDGWRGARGLAEDVRYYGRWMRDEAERRIGHLYPKVELPPEHGGGEARVIAWLWARTVKCPNPACGARMPLVSSFWLSTKPGKKTWIEPMVDRSQNPPLVRFSVRSGAGEPPDPPKVGRGGRFKCLTWGGPVEAVYLRAEGHAGRMGAQLMAIVAEGGRGRIYLPPCPEHEQVCRNLQPEWAPEAELPANARYMTPTLYGMTRHRDLFTARQLVALTTYGDLVGEARERVLADARAAGVVDDGIALEDCGTGAAAHADAVATYLGFAVDKAGEYGCTLVPWYAREDRPKGLFARQAIPMVWDFAEVNGLRTIGGTLLASVNIVADSLEGCPAGDRSVGVGQSDAAASHRLAPSLVSTDPPYYDNVPYADLSDFFYVWLRRSLGHLHSKLFGTLLVPKAAELVADPVRHGGREQARRFFEEGLAAVFARLRGLQAPGYPVSIYYAFKQAESEDGVEDGGLSSSASTGWESMLEGLVGCGFTVNGTWPVRTERGARSRGIASNALASSIVLVCRARPTDAPSATRREFLSALKRELPEALQKLQRGNIAPVDLAQAAIGPGVGVFSRYSRVLEADGSPMPVRAALVLINQTLDEVLAEQEGEFDGETRWVLAWFEQYAMEDGPFGVAETLSKAKNTAVAALAEAGLLQAKAGKVRLRRREELPADWEPAAHSTVWEVSQHLIRALETHGEAGAAALLRKVGAAGEAARDLAYRLYSICERKKWAQEALAYNSLVIAWPEIARLAAQDAKVSQEALF